MNKFLIHRPQL